MKLTDIHEQWAVDGRIDRSDLLGDLEKVPQLHSKWGKIASDERLLLYKHKFDLKRLLLEKREWLITGETRESVDRGWVFPARGKPMRDDMKYYLEADAQLMDMEANVAAQEEKIEVLNGITSAIKYRANLLKSAIEMVKFNAGA